MILNIIVIDRYGGDYMKPMFKVIKVAGCMNSWGRVTRV